MCSVLEMNRKCSYWMLKKGMSVPVVSVMATDIRSLNQKYPMIFPMKIMCKMFTVFLTCNRGLCNMLHERYAGMIHSLPKVKHAQETVNFRKSI